MRSEIFLKVNVRKMNEPELDEATFETFKEVVMIYFSLNDKLLAENGSGEDEITKKNLEGEIQTLSDFYNVEITPVEKTKGVADHYKAIVYPTNGGQSKWVKMKHTGQFFLRKEHNPRAHPRFKYLVVKQGDKLKEPYFDHDHCGRNHLIGKFAEAIFDTYQKLNNSKKL